MMHSGSWKADVMLCDVFMLYHRAVEMIITIKLLHFYDIGNRYYHNFFEAINTGLLQYSYTKALF